MEGFSNIEKKLEGFYKKYYTNELIKGAILFVSFGLLYFLFTIYVEYFLWLEPISRTLLFWVFMLVEGLLFFKFIALPVFHLIKMKKGISSTESSKIIGEYFPEVQDKLLNIIQLKKESKETELLLASIEQKAKELQPIPFVKAVNFKKNLKYAKYLAIPVLVWMISLLSGTNNELSKSLSRVVNFQTEYLPPAPFYFSLETNDLKVIQGKSFTLGAITTGDVLPEEAKILFKGQEYFMQERSSGVFFFTFTNVIEPIEFSLKANEVTSKTFQLDVINTPTIQNISMDLDYPTYTGRKDEKIDNTGNLVVPEGTKIQWDVFTSQTDSVVFIENTKRTPFLRDADEKFLLQKRIRKNTSYQITSSNKNLKDYEKLPYAIKVIKDQYPTILVQSNIDSLTKGDAQFAGQISDDYGISSLELIYYNQNTPDITEQISMDVTKENIQTFFYQFPDQLSLKEGVDYELFFQVSDNDGVNGKKKAISKKFNYRQKTEDEITEEILQDQRNTINNLEKTIQNQKKQKEDLKQIQEDLQNKKDINWNDKKKVDEFVKRQEQYNEMMERQTDKLQENIDEKKEENQTLQQKKEELKKRIEELKKLDRQKKLLDELQKMAEKLDKEDLVRKAKELAQQNKQQERSLERILELTKRFYVEQKTTQIANKLEKLAKKQDAIDNEKQDAVEEQKEIKKEFEKIAKELEELQKDNDKLKEPMQIPEMEDEKQETSDELYKAKQKLQKQQKNQAKPNQKKASKKMKQMSMQMQQSMAEMQSKMIDENIDDLKKILKNLVTFSFKQEDLMNKFDQISVRHPDFGKDLKKQNQIKSYFEHIDDSLYVLSMRTPQLSAKIQEDLSKAHYNLDQSLENFSQNRFSSGLSNQQYVMTSANNLSDFLSDLLDNMQNSSMSSSGKGSGKGKSFSLPELIKQQQGISEQMKKGLQKGKGKEKGDKGEDGKKGKQGEKGKDGNKGKNGQGEGNGDEEMNGELFRIYQQQSELRQQLQEAIKEGNKDGKGNAAAKRALKTMEQLENEILEKGFTQGTLQRMQQMEYELLKLEKAAFEQGKDKKRKSNTNNTLYKKNTIKDLLFKKRFNNQIEILNRQSLPLQENFEKKVQKYFSKKKD